MDLFNNVYHYSIRKINKIVKREYRSRLWYTELSNKPQGFWNDVMRYRLKHKYRITLDPNAKYLIITNEEELDEFADRFGYWKVYVPTHPLQQVKDTKKKLEEACNPLKSLSSYIDNNKLCDRIIEWNWVMGLYKGIIINPYIYERRNKYEWYNGWDCASGCIWDASCIERIEYVKG